MTVRLYEDQVKGLLSEDAYSKLAYDNEAVKAETERRLALSEASEQESDAKLNDIKRWLRLIKKNTRFRTLTRDLLDALVERVEVGERKA
jgi:hypothetical protein